MIKTCLSATTTFGATQIHREDDGLIVSRPHIVRRLQVVGDLGKGDENRGDQFRRLTKFAGEHQMFVQRLITDKIYLKLFTYASREFCQLP